MERFRKRVRHFHEPGQLPEFTFSCYRRWPPLTNNDWRRRLSHAMDGANSNWRPELVAFVFMPEHVHLSKFRPPELAENNLAPKFGFRA